MATKITNYLYIGGYKDVNDKYDYIINLGSQPGFPHVIRSVFHMRAEDIPSFDISVYFMHAIEIIELARKLKKTVLVNCHMGISRSATIVTAYLMYKDGLTAKEALHKLESIKPDINPNTGFKKQLKEFEEQLLSI